MNIDKNKFWKKLFEKFHVVVYSSDSKKDIRNLHFSRFFMISIIVLIISIYTLLMISIFAWTPLGNIFSRSAMETKRMGMLEQKVKNISLKLGELQEYNNHLRYALGDTSASKFEGNIVFNEDLLKTSTFEKESQDNNQNSSKIDKFQKQYDFFIQPFSVPVSSYVMSQKFDEENNHLGLDFAGKLGEPIVAAADGYIIFSNWTLDYGNTIIIMHGSKYITKYKHNSVNLKPVGSFVRRGEVIALLGNSGKLSSSPHLHFELWRNGIAFDPLKFLMIKN